MEKFTNKKDSNKNEEDTRYCLIKQQTRELQKTII